MKSTEERIIELEQRVAHLESIINQSEIEKSEIEKPKIENLKIENSILTDKKEMINIKPSTSFKDQLIWKEAEQNEFITKRPIELARNQYKANEEQTYNRLNKVKNKEALVGKYLVGALASLLVFIGATSFIGLVWNRMTPEMKLSLISLVGILLTTLGFWLIRTKKNPITSIILGTGAGLLFIAILSANLEFHMIGDNASIILAGIWAVFFILSSRYTNLFFTTIIAYIGSYIALLLGLVLMRGDIDLLVMIFFATSISIVMIYNALKNKNNKNTELITSILLSLLSYTTILIICYTDGLYWSEQLLTSYVNQTVVIILIYVLMNMLYKIIDNKEIIPIYLGVSITVTLLTIFYIVHLSDNYLHLKALTCLILFFIINMVQLILSNVIYKRIVKWLTRFYAIILVLTSFLINVELYEVPTGIILIGLLLVVIEKVFKREDHSILIGIIILCDSLLLIHGFSENLICSLYGVLQLGLLVYVLWKNSKLNNGMQISALKTIGLIVIILNSFGIPSNIINSMNLQHISAYLINAVGYLIATIAFVALLKLGYYKNWKDEHFKFLGINDKLENDEGMQVLLHISSTLLYFVGLQGIAFAEEWFLILLFTISTTVISLIQTKLILSRNNARYKIITGIWIVIKYLMLTWTILWSFFDLNITSVAYSIVGLLVAIGSIALGFKLRNKSLRQYGLVLTIIMVAKFIFVDLIQENSITRVLALIAGGGLCFLISVIYNKLNISIDN